MKIIYAFMLLFGSVLLLGCDDDEDPPPDPGHVKVFLTSKAYDGNFKGPAGAPLFPTGLEGADAACTDAANSAGQSGAWTAWLSDSTPTGNAVDRIFDGSVRYQLLNGTVIANNKADLLDGRLQAPILIDESGNTVNGAFEVWTSTFTDGTFFGPDSCLDWTVLDPGENGEVGLADFTKGLNDGTWTIGTGTNSCDTYNRLYCFANVVTP